MVTIYSCEASDYAAWVLPGGDKWDALGGLVLNLDATDVRNIAGGIWTDSKSSNAFDIYPGDLEAGEWYVKFDGKDDMLVKEKDVTPALGEAWTIMMNIRSNMDENTQATLFGYENKTNFNG